MNLPQIIRVRAERIVLMLVCSVFFTYASLFTVNFSRFIA